MNKLQKGAATAVATASLLMNLAIPVFADTTIEISGNGANSDNDVDVEIEQTTFVDQSNTANIKNNVQADSNTGNNDANRNTGGDVDIDTGDATTTVSVANTVNSNEAEVKCCLGDVDVLIAGNGAFSDNDVTVNINDDDNGDTGTFVEQSNEAKIYNDIYADSNTGYNDANRNTGGSVSITTGDASTDVLVWNQANSNSAHVSGNSSGVSLSARILGNGANSYNNIELEFERLTYINQHNSANVRNKVQADSNTGRNRANRNTGGEVSIDTGDASTVVVVDNLLNFNWADVDCGCLIDVLAKISGNGADSYNDIILDVDDELIVRQDNSCNTRKGWGRWGRRIRRNRPCLVNDVYADSDTGNNDTKRNTGDPGADPSIVTGNASTDVLIENTGNSNVFGEAPDHELSFPGGFSFNLNISFNLSDLLAALLG